MSLYLGANGKELETVLVTPTFSVDSAMCTASKQ